MLTMTDINTAPLEILIGIAMRRTAVQASGRSMRTMFR
jgi:hypothetical protein